MEKPESNWKKDKDWKNRYARVYGTQRAAINNQSQRQSDDGTRRISFMKNDTTPYTDLLMRVRANRRDSSSTSSPSPRYLTSLLSQQSDLYGTYTGTGSMLSDNLGGHDTLLLDMVRAQSREMQEAQDQTLDLPPRDDVSDDLSSEACVHGLSMRMTERSVSRSRFSRMSTRRDMDIPSILAFTTTTSAPVHQLEIPAFKMANEPQREEIPRWSIRRSVCPVCSQKWKDKSSIRNIKYSGLKRNSSSELPTVIAPARLRTAITMGYVPRPVTAAIDNEAGMKHGGLRNTSASWQLTRARRFRAPKPQMPSPEATRPPAAAAPLAQRDLDLRVSRFLADGMEIRETA